MYTSLISILICEENERQKKTRNFKFGHILTSRYANSFEEIEPALFRLIYGVLRELFGRRLSPNWTPPIWSFNLFHRIVSCALIWQQRPLPYELCAICRISNGWQDAQNCQINNFNYNFFPFFGFVSWTFQDKFFPPVFGTYEILIVIFWRRNRQNREKWEFFCLSTIEVVRCLLSRTVWRRSDVFDSNNKLWLDPMSALRNLRMKSFNLSCSGVIIMQGWNP